MKIKEIVERTTHEVETAEGNHYIRYGKNIWKFKSIEGSSFVDDPGELEYLFWSYKEKKLGYTHPKIKEFEEKMDTGMKEAEKTDRGDGLAIDDKELDKLVNPND